MQAKTSQDTFSVSHLHESAKHISREHSSLFILGLLSLFTQTSSVEYSRTIQQLTTQDSIDTINQAAPQQLQNIPDIFSNIQNIFSSVHIGWYVLFGFHTFLLVLFSTLVAFIGKIFLTGAMIVGTHQSLIHKENSLGNISHDTKKSLKSLIGLAILPNCIVAVCLILIGSILIGLFAFWNVKFIAILAVVSTIAAILLIIYGGIFLKLSMIWAERFVVLKQEGWRQSLIQGYALAKTHWRHMFVLGIHNAAYVFLRTFGYVMLLILGIVLLFIISVFVQEPLKQLLIIQVCSYVSIGALFVLWAIRLIRFLSQAQIFTSATWTCWFHELNGGNRA